MSVRVFVGLRKPGGGRVYIGDEEAPAAPLRRLRFARQALGRTATEEQRHAPSVFEWGPGSGAGASDLARALVIEVTGDPHPSPRVVLTLRTRLIDRLDGDTWRLREADLAATITTIARKLALEDARAEHL